MCADLFSYQMNVLVGKDETASGDLLVWCTELKIINNVDVYKFTKDR